MLCGKKTAFRCWSLLVNSEMDLEFDCSNLSLWKQALSSYQSRIESLNKPKLLSLEEFYREKLQSLIHRRNPNPYITTSELSQLMQWKLTRGKWRYALSHSLSLSRYMYVSKYVCMYVSSTSMCSYITFRLSRLCFTCMRLRPRLLDFVSALDEELVKSSSQKAFESLPDISKAVNELTVLKGVGPATASAILAAYAPHLAPFMSDEVKSKMWPFVYLVVSHFL